MSVVTRLACPYRGPTLLCSSAARVVTLQDVLPNVHRVSFGCLCKDVLYTW